MVGRLGLVSVSRLQTVTGDSWERREKRITIFLWLSVTWRDKNLDKQFLVDTKITTSDLRGSLLCCAELLSYGLDLIKSILIIMERQERHNYHFSILS